MVFLPIVQDRLSRNLKVRLAYSVHMMEVGDFYCANVWSVGNLLLLLWRIYDRNAGLLTFWKTWVNTWVLYLRTLIQPSIIKSMDLFNYTVLRYKKLIMIERINNVNRPILIQLIIKAIFVCVPPHRSAVVDRMWRWYRSRVDWITKLCTGWQSTAHNAIRRAYTVRTQCQLPVWDSWLKLRFPCHHIQDGYDIPQVSNITM